MNQTILLTVDYHDENCVVRRLVTATGQEDVFTVPTTQKELLQVVAPARVLTGRTGRVVWLQESTNGWARVKALLDACRVCPGQCLADAAAAQGPPAQDR